MSADVTLVYLDQSHVSRLAKHELGLTVDADYGALLDALEQRRDVVCPYSMWHLFETARCEEPLRSAVGRLMGKLSRGVCWRSLDDIVIDELHADAVGGPAPTPTGRGAECFPMLHVAGYVHDVMASGAPDSWFGLLVRAMTDPRMRAVAGQFTDATYAGELMRVPAAAAARVPLDQARQFERAAVARRFLPSLAPQLAERLGVSENDARERLLSRGPDASRSIGFTVEALARHASKYGRKPRRSDGMDWGHMSFFAYAQIVFTEHYDREVFDGAARYRRADSIRCVSTASEMIRLLSTPPPTT